MDEALVPLLSIENEATEQGDPKRGINSRSLQANKDYHVFISYSSEDSEFVKKFSNHLERRLKFRCMVADHHFTSGVPVMENISNSFDKCEKALFVVSKQFLKSGYCETEEVVAYTYAMDNRLKDYVIVLKIDESPLDRKLRVCTYIDGADCDIESIGHRFEMAFTGSDPAAAVENNINGKTILCKYPVELSPNLFGGMEYVFPDLSESEMEQLRSSHIEDSATYYKYIQTEIHRTRLLSKVSFFETRKQTCVPCEMFLGCLTFIFSVLLFIYYGSGSIYGRWYWPVGTLAALIFVCIVCGICLSWKKRIKRKICDGLRSISLANLNWKNNKCFILPRMNKDLRYYTDLQIVFIYYDIVPCWNYFKEHVEWSDTSEEYIDRMCESLFKKIIMWRYLENYLCTFKTNSPRHPTVASQSCLCQLLEELDINKEEREKAERRKSQTDDEETCVMKIVGTESSEDTMCMGGNSATTSDSQGHSNDVIQPAFVHSSVHL